MAYKIVLTPEAFRGIELAECYFKINRIERSFLMDLNEQLINLEKFPLSRQIRYNKLRIHLLIKFNYSLHYVVREKNVYILKFLNQSQDF